MNTAHANTSTIPISNNTKQGDIVSIATISRWLFRDIKPLPRWPVTIVLAICIIVAIGTSSYLLWAGLTSTPIAGCGSGGGWIDCDNVDS